LEAIRVETLGFNNARTSRSRRLQRRRYERGRWWCVRSSEDRAPNSNESDADYVSFRRLVKTRPFKEWRKQIPEKVH
jgi:hypothetical protein